jgi:pilus assembly protein Flp/PilA
MKLFAKIFNQEDGATAIEYGLAAAFISIAALVALTALNRNLIETYGDSNCSMSVADRQDAIKCDIDIAERKARRTDQYNRDREANLG